MMISFGNQACVEDVIPVEALRPLCVDLDGTLVKSDTLIDSLLLLVRNQPLQTVKIPFWILQGKAALKAKCASAVSLDVSHLPYNKALLIYLNEQRNNGRDIYLVTGADYKTAAEIADHLGVFTDIIASDGNTNLTGKDKLAVMKRRFSLGFDYVGNASTDLSILECAVEPMLANPQVTLCAALGARKISTGRRFEDRNPPHKAILKAVRLHQWAKNLLVCAPLLLSHSLSFQAVTGVVLAFACFGLLASATYIVNDLLDMEADRRHPKKRHRPFAAGDLQGSTGFALALILSILAFSGAHFLPKAFLGWLLLYTISTLTYSIYLKRKVLLDVILLSGLYTIRLLAGGAAAQVKISPWLAGFSVFLFLSLAMVKRFSELQNNRAQGLSPTGGRGYLLSDIEQIRSFGTASAYAAVVVFALYINSHDVIAHYSHAARLWVIVPLMILWISRVWLLAGRGELDEDPVIFAVTDRVSLVIGFCSAIVAVLAV
jgi:4-hydroxybenzoate polyprenyltransferase